MKMLLDCKNKVAHFPRHNNATIPFYNPMVVPARNRKVLKIKFNSESHVVGLVEVTNPVECLTVPLSISQRRKDSTILMPVTNNTDKPNNAESLELTLKPVTRVMKMKLIHTPNNKRKAILQEALRLTHLSELERRALFSLLWEYNYIIFLLGDNLENTIVKAEFKINTKPCALPHAKLYRFPEIHKREVQTQIDEYLRQGIIKNSASPWNAPIWVVPKKLDAENKPKWRVVIDYRKLNEVLIDDEYPLPNIDDIFDYLGNAKLPSLHQVDTMSSQGCHTDLKTHLARSSASLITV